MRGFFTRIAGSFAVFDRSMAEAGGRVNTSMALGRAVPHASTGSPVPDGGRPRFVGWPGIAEGGLLFLVAAACLMLSTAFVALALGLFGVVEGDKHPLVTAFFAAVLFLVGAWALWAGVKALQGNR